MCYSMLIEQDLKNLEIEFDAEVDQDAFSRYASMTQRDSKKYKIIAENPRIYPNYFAPIVTMRRGKRIVTPMRYRVRPSGSQSEVPSKYNMFNARIDSLLNRKSWRPLIMKQHGIVMVQSFFEWVTSKGKKEVIQISPSSKTFMAVPVIYDRWVSPDGGEGYASFAVITRAPPPEVIAAGHDRCPVWLSRSLYKPWLEPTGMAEDLIAKIDQENPEPLDSQAATP
ncbi:SOS response-associated peptidase family protein [Pseudobacteriovorax antillogorgiicola]|uniref:Abasic site processing protein n=1 Tax=Pseudobacteriovorax antillogorgiicola TaxID=1513793 RepID=A0A1Y6B805_9BACT|nr:SOS response-associated peptidase family protein [Pseudobacteriovorax antillogorgiicola]TCS58543.1 putative SOS response-associated peptidase YedK [Pseudobacteriovorax antillogorgiicola]SME97786.1 Putative SOS response-associated peptidase YedK [Pseudobacteriovorax antillogorgiicola]